MQTLKQAPTTRERKKCLRFNYMKAKEEAARASFRVVGRNLRSMGAGRKEEGFAPQRRTARQNFLKKNICQNTKTAE